MNVQEKREKNWLEWALGIFTDVRPGEASLALLLVLNAFLVLAAYYILKPLREGLLGREANAAQMGSYLEALVAVIMLFLVPAYGRLVNRMLRARLITMVTGLFMACLPLFWLLGRGDVPYLGYIFFVWVKIFAVMVPAQFWGFANDVYTSESGKRLLPLVAFGADAGTVLGSQLTKWLLRWLDAFALLWLVVVMLGASVALTIYISRRRFPGPVQEERPAKPAPPSWIEGFDLIFKHRYITLIALLVLLLNLVNSNGEFLLRSLVNEDAQARVKASIAAGQPLPGSDREVDGSDPKAVKNAVGALVGSFYGDFLSWTSALSLIAQTLLASRIVRYGGVRAGLLLLPMVAFGTYSLIFWLPVLAYVRIGKIAENSIDYSVNSTTRRMLLLPASSSIKYKAQQSTDAFMQRAGDLFSTGVVFFGTQLVPMSLSQFAGLNLAVILAWAWIAWRLAQGFQRLERGEMPELQS